MIAISRFAIRNGSAVSQGRYIARTLSTEKKYVETTERNGVRTIRLSDSSSRNSLSLEMLKTLVREIKRDEDNKDVRSIVLTSEPGKVFSAGHNLKELTAVNAKSHRDVFEICSELMRAISQSPVPVIAAVDGLAAAAGCQLIAACDIAVCTERRRISGYFARRRVYRWCAMSQGRARCTCFSQDCRFPAEKLTSAVSLAKSWRTTSSTKKFVELQTQSTQKAVQSCISVKRSCTSK
ncbi:enoyl-CoA hydratase domain-containing protein 3, mitochondrial isoform X2 [Temnothorax curvispinosus]|uniref:Enoyl-CoA hydratase domain-containing protein 3, mitochondrial isoform X2 n=1 Tax=Temnothorax curvispinosus TaxID=300111 RepID=A0A6J1Q658_9HYME|nr:enoyl-CoA hydratase domain-containing protein 3, mitochondrial isoform X2 [Temnothorax curvispinosus]